MYIIQNITNNPLQDMTVILLDGTTFYMQMYYIDLQQGWFITQLTYGTFQLQGIRITNSPNFLNQFRNQIPFGLSCSTSGNREPSLIDDFASGASNLYVLSSAEVQEYADYLTSGVA